MVMMTRIEPETNAFRYYRLQLLPNLFGGISLIRHWVRIGTLGRQSISFFDSAEQATEALVRFHEAKLKRGYHSWEPPLSAVSIE